MSEEINHEVFGTLYYDYGWIKNIELEMFGERRMMQVIIDAEEDAIFENAQIESYKQFFKNIGVRIKDAEDATFNYYQSEGINYREQLNGQEKKKFVSEVTEKRELNKLITPKQIMFPMVFEESKREAGFICDCTWEIEHGLGIKFEKEEVIEVGFQDILL